MNNPVNDILNFIGNIPNAMTPKQKEKFLSGFEQDNNVMFIESFKPISSHVPDYRLLPNSMRRKSK